MAKCNYCGSETQLYDGGVAICIPCVDVRDKKRLSPEREGDIRTLLMRKLLRQRLELIRRVQGCHY